MPKRRPIIIIEDDQDDQDMLEEVMVTLEVKNERRYFDNCQNALDYLLTTSEQPFIILSDVNLPRMTGTALKKKINENEVLREKSIPFIFLTTSNSEQEVQQAYEMMVQGYFQKEHSHEKLKQMVKMILDYWSICKHPNTDK